MTNQKLRQDLLKKLNVTKQALSQRVQKLKKETPMTTEEATYVIAHWEGLKLDKYLDNETINKIRQIMPHKTNSITPEKKRRIRQQNTEIIISISGTFKGTDPLLENTIINQANEMAKVYPFLYILENSIRQFICLIMEKECGPNWWDTDVSKNLKCKVEKRMSDENTNSWHQRRGSRFIDYLDLNELPNIMDRIVNKITPKLLPSPGWLRTLIDEIYVSRCVLCHMNPLEKDSIRSVKLRFTHWQKQIKAKISQIK
jgi:hypothetical protein